MEEYIRRLILVPIIHSPADMGSMGTELAEACIERLGRRHWEDYVAVLATFWQSVRTGLDKLTLDYGRVDLYQDGLPVCGKEHEIVKAAAAKGSENHQLLLELIARGATLMGTEDPKLLLEEYRSVQTALASRSSDAGSTGRVDQAASTKALMTERDAYMGRRINDSLRPGRAGILFLGLMHNAESHLAKDIVVTRLDQPATRRRNRA